MKQSAAWEAAVPPNRRAAGGSENFAPVSPYPCSRAGCARLDDLNAKWQQGRNLRSYLLGLLGIGSRNRTPSPRTSLRFQRIHSTRGRGETMHSPVCLLMATGLVL
jgi:hypothetical protein